MEQNITARVSPKLFQQQSDMNTLISGSRSTPSYPASGSDARRVTGSEEKRSKDKHSKQKPVKEKRVKEKPVEKKPVKEKKDPSRKNGSVAPILDDDKVALISPLLSANNARAQITNNATVDKIQPSCDHCRLSPEFATLTDNLEDITQLMRHAEGTWNAGLKKFEEILGKLEALLR